MKKDFIEINKSIQDYSIYTKNVLLLKAYFKHVFKEMICVQGFELEDEVSNDYHSLCLEFYDEERDLIIEIKMRKKREEVFV